MRRAIPLAALALAGCGGHAKPAATPAPAPTLAFANGPVCRRLTTLAGDVGTALSGPGALDPTKPQKSLHRLAKSGPGQIRPDLRRISQEFDRLVPAITAVNASATPDPKNVAKLQRAVARIDQAALGRANAHVTAWVKANC